MDSDNEDIIKAVKDNLGEHPPKSATEFHDRFGYHSLDNIFELPNIDDENKQFLQKLAKTTAKACMSDPTLPQAELPCQLEPRSTYQNVTTDNTKHTINRRTASFVFSRCSPSTSKRIYGSDEQ